MSDDGSTDSLGVESRRKVVFLVDESPGYHIPHVGESGL
jgi:hypothetical protein